MQFLRKHCYPSLLILGCNDGKKLQDDVNKLVQWSCIWGMDFNAKKQTQVAVRERPKNSRQTRSICRQQFANAFADWFCAVHTHQLEFANTRLPTLVCRVKAA